MTIGRIKSKVRRIAYSSALREGSKLRILFRSTVFQDVFDFISTDKKIVPSKKGQSRSLRNLEENAC